MRQNKSITILGRKIKVRFKTDEQLKKMMGYAVHGLYDHKSKTIYISSEMCEKEKRLTLYHELTHAIQFIVGLNQVIPHELQEIICETTANLIDDLTRRK
jgi:Zn-dependent peptidase ImmA (M78 family)